MPLRNNPAIWYNMPGVIAVYQPVAAPDALSARQNVALGNQGRYWATPGAMPTWAPATGWSYSAAQYCDTGWDVPGPDCTLMVRYATSVTDGQTVAGTYSFRIRPSWWGVHYYLNGGNVSATGDVLSGVMCVAGAGGYKNGVLDASISTSSHINDTRLMIGGYYNAGALCEAFTGNVLAVLMAERVLSNAEIWLAAQQMAYCNVNPAWSAWSPQRRWFFIPPPVVAIATPVLSTIYINSADIGDTSLFDDVSGAAVSASYARTGTNSFKLDGADYLQADLTSSATKYSKFGLLVTDTPASDALLVAWLETGTEHVSLYLTDKLTLQMRQGSTIIQTSPTTLETETWYCIETKIVVHDTIGRFQVRIDGVDDMTAIGINTDDGVSGAINEIRFESPVDDTYIDDIVVREDQWCGTGGVYVVVPTAAGTVEEWTGAYSDVDDLPPSFTDYAEVTAESGSDQLFRHGGLGGDYDVSVVGVFAKGRLDSEAAEVTFYALVRSSLTDNVGYAQTLDTIGVYARNLLTTDPNGSAAWTAYAVDNALQVGVRG